MSDPDEKGPEDRPEDLPVQPNAASPRDIRKRETRRKLVEREDREFIVQLFTTPAGRRFVWRILAEASTFQERFGIGPNGFPQPEETWFHAGAQALGQRLYQTFDFIDHDGVSLMLRENDPRFLAKRQG